MPKLDEIKISRDKKGFKKRDYRPWNLDGHISNKKEYLINNDSFSSPSSLLSPQIVIEVASDLIRNWEYNDRPLSELGNIEDLAKEFKEIGQLQPCIVRPVDDDLNYKYELIVGERRWRAAKLANIPLKVIIKNLSNSEAAIAQASENYNREDISDFARGMSYAKLIDNGIISSNELIQKLGISKQQISRLLSFSKIPNAVVDAIQDMSKISARTAEHIKQLCTKGEEYILTIIKLADKIRSGEIGHTKISEYIERQILKTSNKNRINEKLYSRNGMQLFTLKNLNDSSPSIHFHKDFVILLEKKNINIKNIAVRISQIIEDSIGDN